MNSQNPQKRFSDNYTNRPREGGYGRQSQSAQREEIPLVIPDFNDKNLLGSPAEKLAKTIAERTGLTATQLRNFYNEVKNIERILDASSGKETIWNEIYPRIKLIKAKAVYNAFRKQTQAKIPDGYLKFLSTCIDRINAEYDEGLRNFKKFSQLFEAIVGYSRQYTGN